MLALTRWAVCAALTASLLAAGGCDKKTKTDPNEFKGTAPPGADGGAKGAGAPAKAAAASAFKGSGKYLPHPEVAGWNQTGEVRYFNADKLFEFMNGNAEQYKEYGFRELATADYKSSTAAGKTITVEIYDMGSPLGAFGMFGRQTGEGSREEAKDSPEEGEGAKLSVGEGQVMLWKGLYFARVNWLDESAKDDAAKGAGKQHLKAIAAVVAKALPGDVNEPPILAAMSSDGRLMDSTVYYPKEIPGFAGVGPGFAVPFDYDKQKWKSLVVTGAESAKQSLAALRKLAPNGKPVKKLGVEAMAGALQDGTQLVAARSNDVLIAVVDQAGVPKEELMPAADKVSWLQKALAATATK